uniref:Uncharacterized protein n=1 Tax=Picea glauca TaxID=3330 RepID=A0A117NID3_PICGL|nr:hypothetical protein ABT39_MTgene3000 [Picea glauca]
MRILQYKISFLLVINVRTIAHYRLDKNWIRSRQLPQQNGITVSRSHSPVSVLESKSRTFHYLTVLSLLGVSIFDPYLLGVSITISRSLTISRYHGL